MSEIYTVTSGKGGVGKSTFSAGLSCAFAAAGKSVLLVDMDAGLRCLDLMLGVSARLVFDISDVLLGKPLEDAVCAVEGFKKLDLLAAPADEGMIDTFSFASFAAEVAGLYDIVIFDFPAGVDFKLCAAMPSGTTHLVVVTPDVVCIRDAAGICERICAFSDNVRMVLNRFDIRLIKSGIYKNIDDTIDRTGIQLIGIIPYAQELMVAAAKGKPLKRGRAARAFSRISKRLQGENVRLPKPKKI